MRDDANRTAPKNWGPWPPGTEPTDDPRVIAIGEAELRKRTLANLYNARSAWLQHAHATLDRAVWATYGWDDPDPATVEEDTVLARLLALNSGRAGAA